MTRILNVDFDETIACYSFPIDYREVPNATLWLNRIRQLRNDPPAIILWTERDGPLLDAAVAFCQALGLHFDAVNKNIFNLPFTSAKVHCDMEIDNRDLGCPLIPGPFGKMQVDWEKAGPIAYEFFGGRTYPLGDTRAPI